MRKRVIAAGIVAVALAIPALASAWQVPGSNFFPVEGVPAQSSKITLEKCNGPKLGDYTLSYRNFVLVNDPTYAVHLKLNMRVRFPVTSKLEQTKVLKLSLIRSPSVSAHLATKVRSDLVAFFNNVKVKALDSDANRVRIIHGSLLYDGSELIPAANKAFRFDPKPGC